MPKNYLPSFIFVISLGVTGLINLFIVYYQFNFSPAIIFHTPMDYSYYADYFMLFTVLLMSTLFFEGSLGRDGIIGKSIDGNARSLRTLNNPNNPPIQLSRLILLRTRASTFVGIFALIFTFISLIDIYYMWSVNPFKILSGEVDVHDVERALKEAPFGLNGMVLTLSYLTLLTWRLFTEFNYKSYAIYVCLFFAIYEFISQGKAQGMLYFFATLLFNQQKVSSKTNSRLMVYLGFTLILFLVSRILRNQGADLEINNNLMLNFIFGSYLGAPMINASYVHSHPEISHFWLFFRYLFPSKSDVVGLDDVDFFPDPTSPLGLIGSSIMLGSLWLSAIYMVLSGALAGTFFRMSHRRLDFMLFSPFLVIAMAFAALFNHFMNLMFFWLPLFMSWLLVRYLVRNSQQSAIEPPRIYRRLFGLS